MPEPIEVSGVNAAKEALALVQGEIPYATSVALNNVGKDVIAAQKLEMQKVFDRPTPYALNSLFQTYARKDNLETRTRIKSPDPSDTAQGERGYMGTQIFGGSRKDKGSEKTMRAAGLLPDGYQMVPGAGITLNQYGNVTGGRVAAILNNLIGTGSWTNAAGTFVVGEVGGTWGIWKVQRNKWSPQFIFVRDPSYQPRFDYHAVSEQEFLDRWKDEFAAAVDKALKTGR